MGKSWQRSERTAGSRRRHAGELAARAGRGSAGALRARRAGLGRPVDAVPRAHGRDRRRPARASARAASPPSGRTRSPATPRFLGRFLDHLGIARVRVVAHDWGAAALLLGDRVERAVAIDGLPLLPDHRWPPIARAWRTPFVGELAMGFTEPTRRCSASAACGASTPSTVLQHFDHGTQRAILKLYRREPGGAGGGRNALEGAEDAGAGGMGRATGTCRPLPASASPRHRREMRRSR